MGVEIGARVEKFLRRSSLGSSLRSLVMYFYVLERIKNYWTGRSTRISRISFRGGAH